MHSRDRLPLERTRCVYIIGCASAAVMALLYISYCRHCRCCASCTFKIGTCESAVCVRIEFRVESSVNIRIRIESRIESAVGPRHGTARHRTAVGRYRGAPLTRDAGIGAGERRRGRGSQPVVREVLLEQGGKRANQTRHGI